MCSARIWQKRFRPGEREVDAEQMRLFFTDLFAFAGFPGGEDARAVMARTQAFLKELIARDDDRTYLVATHGCALRALMHQVYEDKSSFWHGKVPDNCAVSIVSVENGQSRLLSDDRIYYDRSEGTNLFRSERMG